SSAASPPSPRGSPRCLRGSSFFIPPVPPVILFARTTCDPNRLRPALVGAGNNTVPEPRNGVHHLAARRLVQGPAIRAWSSLEPERLAEGHRHLGRPRPAAAPGPRPCPLAGRGKRRPLGHARPEPLMYAGTTAAPLDTAKRPAPGLADRISPSSPRVPSGNTSSAPPSSSTRRAVRRALGSVPSRRIGRALSAWINVRKSGISKSSALAR